MDQLMVKKTVSRMTEARATLIKNYPFFGHLSMGLQLACAPCETACTDGDRLIFDPEFAERLSDTELQFVTLHELLHCVLDHCLRGKNLHSFLYNIACDIVVNSTILEMWGLHTIRIDGEEAIHLTPEGKEGRLYSADEVYLMLLRDRKRRVKKNDDASKKGHTSSPDQGNKDMAQEKEDDGEDSANENRRGNRRRNTADENQGGNSKAVPSFDRHDLWRGIYNGAQLHDNWNRKIKEALEACGSLAGMPQVIRRLANELAERSRLDWKQLLHDFIQFDSFDYNFLPPDRRFAGSDFLLPAFNIDEDQGSVNDIWVLVDTSASITDKELASAMAEILDAMRQAGLKGKISFFDSSLSEPQPFETMVDFQKITPLGGGGTSFQIIFDYLKEKLYDDPPKAMLIFTDGYAPWPREEDALSVPVLWLITRDGRDSVPWGRVVKL